MQTSNGYIKDALQVAGTSNHQTHRMICRHIRQHNQRSDGVWWCRIVGFAWGQLAISCNCPACGANRCHSAPMWEAICTWGHLHTSWRLRSPKTDHSTGELSSCAPSNTKPHDIRTQCLPSGHRYWTLQLPAALCLDNWHHPDYGFTDPRVGCH